MTVKVISGDVRPWRAYRFPPRSSQPAVDWSGDAAGLQRAMADGFQQGIEKGYQDGLQQGEEAGRQAGFEQGAHTLGRRERLGHLLEVVLQCDRVFQTRCVEIAQHRPPTDVEANRLGAHEAARQYAETAAEAAPYLPWAAKATLEYRCRAGHWDDAIRLLDQQRIEETHNNLRLISELTTRMASIIAHLRAFARRDRHAPESVALQPALEDALALLAKRRRSLDVELIRDLPETPLWVQAGETRLRQVLGNLLGNALDALSGVAPPRRLWLTVEQRSDSITLLIRDNGPGFSPEALQRAREPFFTTKTNAQGLGLGLAICDNLISALGGELALANHPQGGALLSLNLQRAAGGTSAQSAEDSPL